MTDRAQQIYEQFEELFFKRMRCGFAPMDKEAWEAMGLGHEFGFGWLPPMKVEHGVIVSFCADVIAEQTAELDDVDFETYVGTIEHRISRHVQWIDELDLDARRIKVENELYEKAPAAFELISEVESAALAKAG